MKTSDSMTLEGRYPLSSKFFIFLAIGIFLWGCRTIDPFEITGSAQGTSYSIKYIDQKNPNLQRGVDSILNVIDDVFSTYDTASFISRFNKANDTIPIAITNKHFLKVLSLSKEVYKTTNGAFDPTVYSLVRKWGLSKHKTLTEKDTISTNVKLDQLNLIRNADGWFIIKKNPNLQLDFNAIAQGYSIDIIAAYIESKGVKDYIIELGGEVKASGQNQNNTCWKVGIDIPKENQKKRQLITAIQLCDKSLATSGNYRNFIIKNGEKYGHTINPNTKSPAKNSLLSASIIMKNCALADAYATAFMVMGIKRSVAFIKANQLLEMEAYLIYSNKEGIQTFKTKNIKEEEF